MSATHLCSYEQQILFERADQAPGILGRSERIRTSGPCVPNTVLYQAELHSDRGAAYSDPRRIPQDAYCALAAANDAEASFVFRACQASIKCSTVAAVSSMDRFVTSITGQPRLAHRRRAQSNSALTASSST